jgi:hypothetical protein
MAVARAHLVRKPAEDRVELEEVCQSGVVGDIADRLDPYAVGGLNPSRVTNKKNARALNQTCLNLKVWVF